MKFFHLLYLWFSLFLFSLSWGQDFLPSFGDIPLFSDIVLDGSSSLNFDVADGRIVEISGEYVIDRFMIVDFYRDVMPSLGWVESDRGLDFLYFVRGSEIFRIDFVAGSMVIFSLGPEV